ncbi:thioesterase [Leptolyngbyaceae cyanobacterium CCMR0082]|uniref:Thioesterase n=2 Tax=Adonisia turfae TaxID=2950184 RepID=A0A6M0S900_9CYAN|nr:alpha/beta fold hydrolase [Adonisia turfae]MDV3347384.1 alpha/beta fold hydrolase [Leptothoe sp. LEGE 181152]NEZ59860.1 thioesterase [Adonisia turfae CCMR0081]NEZ64954.1 thioesterase [Adonisia turfae CCMR0082]
MTHIPENSADWLIPLGEQRSQARLNVFCFPPAGSGSVFFRHWPAAMPGWINLWALRLPGRETRFREPLLTQWPKLVEPLVQALTPHCDQPFVLFGHSFGALVSFEVAHQLRDRFGYAPVALAVSARQPPHTFAAQRDDQQDDATLIAELRADEGTPEVVLQDTKMMELLLRIYRADLYLNRTYSYYPRGPLSCPILALGGENDKGVNTQDLMRWQEQTDQTFQLKLFPGGHMYLVEEQNKVAMIQALTEFVADF